MTRKTVAAAAAALARQAAESGGGAERAGVAPLDRSGLLLNLAFWGGVVVLVGLAGVFLPAPMDGRAGRKLAPFVMLNAATWAAATPAIFWLASRFGLEQGNRAARMLLFAAIGILVTPFLALIDAMVLTYVISPETDTLHGDRGLLAMAAGMLPPTLLTYAAVAAAGLAREASMRAQARREQAARLQTQNATLTAQLTEARLAVLRAQLNPHFLFNTLNAVLALMDSDPRGVRRMVSRLSELLRYALRDDRDQLVVMDEEARLVRIYLDIAEIRYQGELKTEVTVGDEVHDALVPSMILQPLVENAMKHGVSQAGGRGCISVQALREEDRLVLRVRDTGPGTADRSDAEPLPELAGNGLGLRHTRERLDEIYGSEGRLELRPLPDGGMLAEITMPFYTRADLRSADPPPAD